MKQYVIWILSVLVLASCRTKQVSLTQKSDSVVAHSVRLSDSISVDTHFEFDKLDIYFNDNDNLTALGLDSLNSTHPLRGLGGHISISGGSLTSNKTKTKTENQVDSVSVSDDKYTVSIYTPPKPNKWLVIAILGILGCIIIASRTRK